MNQSDEISDQIEDTVGLDGERCIAVPIPALIGCHDAIPGIGQRFDLMSPRVPGLRPTVAQHNEWA